MIRSFGFWAFTPNPSAQNPKRKKKFENFLKQVFLSENKRKGIHQLTRHIWLRFASGEHPSIFYSATLRPIVHVETLNNNFYKINSFAE
ncbi:hypothetical protein KKF69_03460 [Patescibacteria group bacterium]|nr:hypothetical protein [Patescibacteria group bacterium]